MIELQSLTIVPASQAQIIEAQKRTRAEWGYGADEEAYLKGYEEMENHEVANEGKHVTWILVKRDDPESLDFFCACTTLRRECLVRIVSNDDQVEVKRVTGYSIGSVFTPERHRKKGYATHMMQLLHWVLAPDSVLNHATLFPRDVWGEPPKRSECVEFGDAAFSVLYSGIGAEFYTRCTPWPKTDERASSPVGSGWVVTSPKSTMWNVDKLLDGLTQIQKSESKDWDWLDHDGVKRLWEIDAQAIEHEMGRPSSSATTESQRDNKQWETSFLPDKGVAAFQYQDLKSSWSKMDPVPVHWGVCESLNVSPNAKVMATWIMRVKHRGPDESLMIITRLRSSPPERFDGLIKQVALHARFHGVREIEAWNLPDEVMPTATALGGRTYERDDVLSSFKWYGEEDVAGPDSVGYRVIGPSK